MCGIVGYLGNNNSVDVILKGLTRLEYRGYDSAGICLKDDKGNLVNHRKVGKLINLKNYLNEIEPFSTIGIGHTRWATHGAVTDLNAHPHSNERIAIVHNGIIENASQLKKELEMENVGFNSDTDSEVFLVLLTKLLESGESVESSIRQAFKRIKGNSAFVILSKDTDELFAIKRTAPLVCGTNEETGELFLSSDPYALIGYAKTIYFPGDEILCRLNKAKGNSDLSFYDLNGNESHDYQKQQQRVDEEQIEKGSYEHFMLKEIHEQPARIRKWIEHYSEGPSQTILSKLRKLDCSVVNIVACGTAWHAGLIIGEFLERYNKVHAQVELASEFRYRNPLLKQGEIGLMISQSGETADTLAAEELCKNEGLDTYSIVNVEGSTLYRNSTANLLIKAGQEIGVASTKAFTLQVLTGFLFSRAVLREPNYESLFSEVELLIERVGNLLKDTAHIQSVAKEIYDYKGYLFTARGKYYPIALEGALKLKEIAYVHAEGYAAGELKHGPIALVDDSMVNIAIVGPELYDKTVSNLEEVKARRGVIVVIGPENDSDLEQKSDYYIPLNFNGLENLSPLYVNVVNQLLSYYMASYKGTDIDKPRNLAKSVTVE